VAYYNDTTGAAGHGAQEPDTTTLASCHTQAMNSEFPVRRVYFDVRLDLVEIDGDFDVQDKIYSTSMHLASYYGKVEAALPLATSNEKSSQS